MKRCGGRYARPPCTTLAIDPYGLVVLSTSHRVINSKWTNVLYPYCCASSSVAWSRWIEGMLARGNIILLPSATFAYPPIIPHHVISVNNISNILRYLHGRTHLVTESTMR